MFVKKHRLVTIFALALILAGAFTFINSCGGGGGGSDSATNALDTSATGAGNSDMVKLITGDPDAPTLQQGAPITAMAAPPCPPPAGASANNTINTYYKPSNAFDGNVNSWWVGAIGAGSWDLYYAFPNVRNMDSLSVQFYGAQYVPTQMRLKVSTDGCTWTDKGLMAGSVTPSAAVGQSIRYVWIEMTGNPAINYPLVREVDWTPPQDNVGPSGGPGVNDAWYYPARAFDGDTNTWWVGQVGAGAWDLYYGFDTPRVVQMVTTELFNSNYRPTNMELRISNDGQNWTSMGEMEPGGSAHAFAGQTTQYIHVKMTGNPPSNFPLIKDISLDIPPGASSGDSISTFYRPANAFDGYMNTWWVGAQNQSDWTLIYRYASDTYVNNVDISYYAATHAPASATLYISTDGDTWTQQASFPSGADTTASVQATAQYLRFEFSGTPSVGYPLIKDITVSTGSAFACTTDVDCDDGNPFTTNVCHLGGTPNAVCGQYSVNMRTDAGRDHSCALLASGVIKCWGFNIYGQLGDGTTAFPTYPTTVLYITNGTGVSVGYSHTCAVLADGGARCWGDNQMGSLGDGTSTQSLSPVAVSGVTDAVQISAGKYASCVLLAGGGIKCWGDNYYGQLGTGYTYTTPTPTNVVGISNAVAVSTAYRHTCAALASGEVKCWGDNASGQLGNGATTSSLTPVSATGITNAIGVSVGEFHTCALLSTGTVKCWGKNEFGQLGNGTTTNSLTPVSVSGLTGAVRINAGFYHSCAVLSGGTMKCWGFGGTGELGNGADNNSTTPVSVSVLTDVLDSGNGEQHICATKSNGDVYCWGGHWSNQLGYQPGCMSHSNVPLFVPGL